MFAVAKAKRPRGTLILELPDEMKAAIKELADEIGMSQREMTKRLYEWLVGQDEVVRAAVLRQIPKSVAPDVARIVLARMAEPPVHDIGFIPSTAPRLRELPPPLEPGGAGKPQSGKGK
jgi:hypothetical protein